MKANTWIALLAYEACIQHAAECRRNEETATRLGREPSLSDVCAWIDSGGQGHPDHYREAMPLAASRQVGVFTRVVVLELKE